MIKNRNKCVQINSQQAGYQGYASVVQYNEVIRTIAVQYNGVISTISSPFLFFLRKAFESKKNANQTKTNQQNKIKQT